MNTKKLILLLSCGINFLHGMQGPITPTSEPQPVQFQQWFEETNSRIKLKTYQTAQTKLSDLEKRLGCQSISIAHFGDYNDVMSTMMLPRKSISFELPLAETLKLDLRINIQNRSVLISKAIKYKTAVITAANREATLWHRQSFSPYFDDNLKELKAIRDYLNDTLEDLKANYKKTNPEYPSDIIQNGCNPENYDNPKSFEYAVARSRDEYTFTKKTLVLLNKYIEQNKRMQSVYKTLPNLR